MGDDIQAIKAGILEIADVFIVNKAEREGSDRAVSELSMMLDLSAHGSGSWRPPIVKTTAPSGAGVPEAVQALESHGDYLAQSAEGARRRAVRARSRLLALLEERFRRTIEARAPEPDGLEEAVRGVTARREDPYTAAGRLFDRLVRDAREGAARMTAGSAS